MRYVLSTLALTALASSCVAALGINCQGSALCGNFISTATLDTTVAENLREQIARVNDNRWYQNGERIVCVYGGASLLCDSICTFLQNTGGLPGNEIKTLAQRIVEHGCTVCGSVPVFFDQGDNNVDSHGELTFNFVSFSCFGRRRYK
jgi:hypothetical protein